MEAMCPRCLYSFFPAVKTPEACPPSPVYAHECATGYYRPYPQFMCSLCGPGNDDTILMSAGEVVSINRDRKLTHFRELEDKREKVDCGECIA